MNAKTKITVKQLLHDATFEGDSYTDRMRRLNELKESALIGVVEYLQLVDAVNTHENNGNYEGCIIWRNAENNPLG